jgi:hypothetical protein
LALGASAACKEYGLQARSVAMWAIWELCELTLREIGGLFNGMDYAGKGRGSRLNILTIEEAAVDVFSPTSGAFVRKHCGL